MAVDELLREQVSMGASEDGVTPFCCTGGSSPSSVNALQPEIHFEKREPMLRPSRTTWELASCTTGLLSTVSTSLTCPLVRSRRCCPVRSAPGLRRKRQDWEDRENARCWLIRRLVTWLTRTW